MIEYFRELTRLPAGVRRFIATESLLGIGIGIFVLTMNLHLLDRGVEERDIGAINAAGALITGLASIPAGFAMRKIGRKRALIAGVFIMAAGYAAYGAANVLFSFYAAQCVVSVGVTLLVTSEIQLLFRYCAQKKDEPRAYGGLFASFTFFLGIGTLLGGWLPDALPLWNGRYGGALAAASFFLFLGGIARAWLLPKEPAEISEEKSNDPGTFRIPGSSNYRSEVRNISVLTVFLFLSGLLFGFLGPFLNVIVKLRFGLEDTALSVIFALYGIALFLGSLLMPYAMERWGIGKTFGRLYFAEFLLLLLLSANIPVAAFVLPFILRGGTYTMLNHLTESQSMSAVSDNARNAFAGIRTVAKNAGISLASVIAGHVLAGEHYGWPFLLAAAAIALHAVFFFTAARPIMEKPQELQM